ncbi:hypothetical protein [Streptomyces naganishii]|uniref:Uncharacterized protein n=1 Tax=Streptomyces naganishii JCM 4654 TaxID=1306179 RepID=A0A918XYK6_9ACTN|nr:hypothetical protein [Streptomyces naganishii]GHD83736.1 hypothetical protein GCM10010508_00560 [Streptomyces naganishii JCM 4654]
MRAVLALARHEARLLGCLVLWVVRRGRPRGGGQVFGYARGQGPVMAGLACVCLVETLTMSVLLRHWPTVHAVVLFLDAYTVVFVIALYASCVIRPHLLTPDAVRIRHSVHLDLRIPPDAIAAVRHEVRTTHAPADGELNVPVGSRTSVTIELAAPVTHITLFGGRREVRVVRFQVEEAERMVRSLSTLARSAT